MNSRIPSLVSMIILCGGLLFSQWAYAQQQDPSAGQTAPPTAQTAPAAAQPEPPAAQAAPPAEPKMSLPAPTDKDLAFLLGKWETKIKIFPNALLANKEELKGAGTAEYQVFGKVIEGTLSSETSSGKYEGREFIWYDQNSKVYNIISISPEGYAANKKMTKEGDKFVVEYTGVHKPDGKKEIDFTVTAKYKIISDTEVKYSSEVKVGKTNFVPFIQLKMQRVSK
jgi:hypothetical protein